MKIYINDNCWVIEDFLNTELVNEIKNIIKKNLNNLYKNKKDYSTKGKNSEQYWIINRKNNFFINDPMFCEFEKKYNNEIIDRIKSVNLFYEKIKSEIYLSAINAWSVIGEENSYHTIHYHNDGYFDGISTLLYLEVPKENCDDEPENNIYLVTNSGVKNPFYNQNQNILSINPEVGKLLIFPDWVLHGTYPQTKGIRQSFNIDYKIVLKNNKNTKFFYS
jgi:hypothetical protein